MSTRTTVVSLSRVFVLCIGALLSVSLLTDCGGGSSSPAPQSAPPLPNTPPVSDAGANQELDRAAFVTLDGSGSSDADNDPLSYTWTQFDGPTVTLDTTHPDAPTFTAPDKVATISFDLEVSDGTYISNSDRVYVYVMENNSSALFVDGDNGSDTTGTGTRDNPYATISTALANVTTNREDIYVKTLSSGTYTETQTLGVPDGTSLYGGFGADWARDETLNRTLLQGDSTAVQFSQFTQEAWFSGFDVTAANSADASTDVIGIAVNVFSPGPSLATVHIEDNVITAGNVGPGSHAADPGTSYGVVVLDVENVEIRRNAIQAGNGGRGSDGLNGPAGANGSDGSPGDSASASQGGAGGAGGAGPGMLPGAAGGTGGSGSFAGASGSGPLGGSGGAAGTSDPGVAGGSGQFQADGADSAVGGGGVGTLPALPLFLDDSGTRGLDGSRGTGGSGGGGGGSTTTGCGSIFADTFPCEGGGGGGGGAGGLGGIAGDPGEGGGASIGLFLNSSVQATTVYVFNNEIGSAQGGDGGSGGHGGAGGLGGFGGAGGSGETGPSGNGGAGSDGGAGGLGGHGGDASGGGGGPSFGIYIGNVAAGTIDLNDITAGNGGNGGGTRNAVGGDGGWSYAIFSEGTGGGGVNIPSGPPGGNNLSGGTPGGGGIAETGGTGIPGVIGQAGDQIIF